MSTTPQPGDKVLVRGEILNYDLPRDEALVEFFSKTDQWKGLVRGDLLTSGILLDLDDAAHCLTALRLAESQQQSITARLLLHSVIGKIEAQTKPPRIPEPEWGGRVIAHTVYDAKRAEWVRWMDEKRDEHTLAWKRRDGGTATWDDLIDPVLVRPGIEDES